MKYIRVEPGEWVRPVRKGYKMMCCDCGLTHKLDFKLVEGRYIELRGWRDNRATANSRRASKVKVINGTNK